MTEVSVNDAARFVMLRTLVRSEAFWTEEVVVWCGLEYLLWQRFSSLDANLLKRLVAEAWEKIAPAAASPHRYEDFISYLHGKGIASKDLLLEFTDRVFKHFAVDQEKGHYLSYAHDLIGFVNDAAAFGNEVLQDLLNEGLASRRSLSCGLLPVYHYTTTAKGQEFLQQLADNPPDQVIAKVSASPPLPLLLVQIASHKNM